MTERIQTIIAGLNTKAGVKQKVYKRTSDVFNTLKNQAQKLVSKIDPEVKVVSPEVETVVNDYGDFEFHLKFSGDTVVFLMHTNVFTFPPNHGVSKSKYIKQEPNRGYFGMIQVYNFLSDSIKYNRLGDPGYLLARIYINNENHFYVDGKRQLGFLYKNVEKQEISDDVLCSIIEQCILYCIDFDLYVPPADSFEQITIQEKNYFNNPTGLATGKRLGFKVINRAKQ